MSDSPSLRTPNTTAQEGEALGETMSEPFAAIPLRWGAKPCPYHTFLIWLACLMSGQDGFKGLKAGQVKFSRRDAEIALGQSHSLVTSHTRRAIRDGYLKPQGVYGKHRGEGEVYDCLSDLLSTRNLYSVPRMSQQATIKVPTKDMETLEVTDEKSGQSPNKVPRSDRINRETK